MYNDLDFLFHMAKIAYLYIDVLPIEPDHFPWLCWITRGDIQSKNRKKRNTNKQDFRKMYNYLQWEI